MAGPFKKPRTGAANPARNAAEPWHTPPLDALIVVDQDEIIRMVNDRVSDVFGRGKEELVGCLLEVLLPRRLRPEQQGRLGASVTGQDEKSAEYGFAVRRDGSVFEVRIGLTPLELAQEQLVIVALQDMSPRGVGQQTRAALRLEQLKHVLETSPNEIYLFDARTFRFAHVNRSARANLGYTLEELETLTPRDLEPELDTVRFSARLEPLRAGEREQLEYTTFHRRRDGTRYPVAVHLQFDRETETFAAVVLDITERQEAARQLQESREQLALHTQRTPLAVLEWRLSDRVITSWNSAAERIFGYQAGEVVNRETVDLLLVDHDPALRLTPDTPPNETQGRRASRCRTQEGRIIMCEWYYTLLHDTNGTLSRGVALGLDVTTHHRALEALVEAQDHERARIARDLHDSVGQALTAIGLSVASATNTGEADALEGIRDLVADTLEEVRRLSRDLRPALLDELGLEAALEHLVEELQRHTEVKISLFCHVSQRPNATEDATLFRVVQEALTNIVRHARARHASVVLMSDSEHLQLVVEDNGVGFNADDLQAGRHAGLVNMRERVEMLGGVFKIESEPGQGVVISVRLPF